MSSNMSLLDDLEAVIEAETATYQHSYKNAVLVFSFNGDEGHRLAHFMQGGDMQPPIFQIPKNQPQRFNGLLQNVYALPEFQSFTNLSDQLINAHFLQKVIKDAKLVKFVITANYATLSNNKDTLTLLSNVANFIRHINKFQDSFILVIQDVAEDRRDGVIKKIRNHLNVLKHGDGVSKNIQDLIDILVSPNHITTTLSVNPVQDRPYLNDFIDTRTFQLADDLNDFQYVFNFEISDETKRMLELIVNKLAIDMTQNLEEVVQYAKMSINIEVNTIYGDFKKLNELLTQETNHLATIQWRKTKTMRNFSEDLTKLKRYLVTDDTKIWRVLKKIFEDIYNLALIESYLQANGRSDLLTELIEKSYKIIINVKDHVKEWTLWVDYLQQVNNILITNASKGPDLLAMLQRNEFPEYFKSIKSYANIYGINFQIKEFKIDDVKYRMLHDMTEQRSNGALKYKCDGDTYRIEGDQVYITELKYPKCKGKQIEVFAYDTVSFNMDVAVDQGFTQLTIIAPKWDIHGRVKKITLTGKDGQKNINPAWADKYVAGKAGYPGAPSGSFFGIGGEFHRPEVLTVVQKSGSGGNGQHGGCGRDGQDGKVKFFAAVHRHPYSPNGWRIGAWIPNLGDKTCENLEVDDWRKIENFVLTYKNKLYDVEELNSYDDVDRHPPKIESYMYGEDGYPGGRGGAPGKKGFYLMYPIGKNDVIKIRNDFEPGQEGVPGYGGEGAKSGTVPDFLICEDRVLRFNEMKTVSQSYGPGLAIGKKGELGGSTKDLVPLKEPEIPEIGAILERYRNNLRHKINDPFQTVPFDEFLTTLYDSEKLIDEYVNFEKYYSRKYGNEKYRGDFLRVFENLETQFLNNENRNRFAFFYQLFLKDIMRFTEVSDEKEFYQFLYSTVFTKMVALQNRENANMIIDFNGYLNIIVENIKKQKNLRQVVSVNNAQKVYETSLNEKITEAMAFTTEINKGIDSNVVSIEGEIKKFISEVDKVTEKLREHRDKLIVEEEKMKRNIALNRIFGVLKVIAKVVSILGPIGSVVGGISDTVLGIGESIAKEEEFDTAVPEKLKKVGEELEKTFDTIQGEKSEVYKEEVKNLKEQLKKIENEETDDADAKAEAKEIAEALEHTANGLDNPNQTIHERNALQRKLKRELREKEAALEKREDANEKVVKQLKRFNDAISVVDESFNVYKTWKKDDKKLSEIGKKIKDTRKSIKDMEVYREKVENTVGPLLDKLRTDLQKIDLTGKSQVALDVKRWDIKARLTDLKIYMRQLLLTIDNTSGIKEDIATYVDKLEDTMNTMINVYDRIEAIRERKMLIKYIAHVNTAQSKFEHIRDDTVREQLETLNLNVQESLVMWQYESYMDQVNQWVFPFAERYLQDIITPTKALITRDNKREIFDTYVTNIEHLKSKLEMYKKVIVNEHDSCLFFSIFSTQYVSTRPFYTWTKDRYASVINDLLEGRDVYLPTNINSAHANKFGLKFNVIGLEFTTDDPKDQTTLTEIMQNVMVTMTHTGNSYYRCDNDIYMITNEPQTLRYSYEMRANSMDPVTANDVYKKLKTGDLILSPFTTWKVRLSSEYNQEKVVQRLVAFKGKVNVVLKGKGYYTTDTNVCNKMERYKANQVTNQDVKLPLFHLEPFALDNNTDYMVDDILEKYKNLKVIKMEPSVEQRSAIGVTSNVVNSVAQNVFNWFYDKWNSTSASTSFHPTFDMNSSLLLLDVMYKRFTNKKFEPIGVRRDVPLMALQAEAIKLTSGVEAVIDTLVLYSEGLEHFDPVATQKELMRLLRTSDATTINNYLIDTVQRSVPLASIGEIEQLLEKGDLLG